MTQLKSCVILKSYNMHYRSEFKVPSSKPKEKPVEESQPGLEHHKKKLSHNLFLYIFTFVVVVICLCEAIYIYITNQSYNQLQPAVIEGLRLAATQQYKEATKYFDQISYHQLQKDDQKAVLFSYLLAGNAKKALDLEPSFAESVVSYYIANDNIKQVKNLKSDAPVVKFEKAVLEKDAQKIITLKNNVPLNGRREKIIVDAYIVKNQVKEALSFAKKVGNKDLEYYIKEKRNY